jgi:hypothetical protein
VKALIAGGVPQAAPTRFLAEELRRLAERFERTADAAAPEKMPSDNGREQNSH